MISDKTLELDVNLNFWWTVESVIFMNKESIFPFSFPEVKKCFAN